MVLNTLAPPTMEENPRLREDDVLSNLTHSINAWGNVVKTKPPSEILQYLRKDEVQPPSKPQTPQDFMYSKLRKEAGVFYGKQCEFSKKVAQREFSKYFKRSFDVDCRTDGKRQPVVLDHSKTMTYEFKPRGNKASGKRPAAPRKSPATDTSLFSLKGFTVDLVRQEEVPENRAEARPGSGEEGTANDRSPLLRYDKRAWKICADKMVELAVDEGALYGLIPPPETPTMPGPETKIFIPFEVRRADAHDEFGGDNRPFVDAPPRTVASVRGEVKVCAYLTECLERSVASSKAAFPPAGAPLVHWLYTVTSLGDIKTLIRHRFPFSNKYVVVVKCSPAHPETFHSSMFSSQNEVAMICTKCFITKKELVVINVVPVSEAKAKVMFVERVEWAKLLAEASRNRRSCPRESAKRGEACSMDPATLIETSSEALVDFVYLEPGDYLLRYYPNGSLEHQGAALPGSAEPSRRVPNGTVCTSTCRQDGDSFDFHCVLECQVEGVA